MEKLANKAIERPTTVTNTTTNNNLNITSCLDFNNLDRIKDAIENKKPGELVLIGNYPKAGWNA